MRILNLTLLNWNAGSIVKYVLKEQGELQDTLMLVPLYNFVSDAASYLKL